MGLGLGEAPDRVGVREGLWSVCFEHQLIIIKNNCESLMVLHQNGHVEMSYTPERYFSRKWPLGAELCYIQRLPLPLQRKQGGAGVMEVRSC